MYRIQCHYNNKKCTLCNATIQKDTAFVTKLTLDKLGECSNETLCMECIGPSVASLLCMSNESYEHINSKDSFLKIRRAIQNSIYHEVPPASNLEFKYKYFIETPSLKLLYKTLLYNINNKTRYIEYAYKLYKISGGIGDRKNFIYNTISASTSPQVQNALDIVSKKFNLDENFITYLVNKQCTRTETVDNVNLQEGG